MPSIEGVASQLQVMLAEAVATSFLPTAAAATTAMAVAVAGRFPPSSPFHTSGQQQLARKSMLPTAVSISPWHVSQCGAHAFLHRVSDVARLQFRCRTAELTLLSALVYIGHLQTITAPPAGFWINTCELHGELTALGCAAGF